MARTGERETVWELKPHTAAKHQLLTGYLKAWFPILSRWNARIVFLDGFAGPGIYKGEEYGSPIKALDVLLKHTHRDAMANKEFVFLFNEAEQDRYEQLEIVVRDYVAKNQPWPSNVKVSVGSDSFENVAEGILGFLEQQKSNLAPTFAFVDPFGVKGLPMDLLRRLLSFDRCELFVYFDFNTVNRFANAGNIDDRLTELFGTDLFKQARGLTGAERKAFLHDLYQSQLVEVCGFSYVKSFEMVNSSGHTGYFLFYGTRNIKGLEVMKDVMWTVDPGSGEKFSDILAGQDVLFQAEVDTRPLQQDMAQHFRGQLVSVETLAHYVLVDTPYALKHLKKLTLKPMQKEGVITSPNQKRTGTFPEGTLIKFAD
ncbi:three-Cys-motif partner protein TcmP [Amycolatopsis sp. K13G38]|uniref:Three-Cys-motif partner protein TcmP n=1 Tax=Amycolatopsis acididurans TaxID=2724524 RepID=A0ABX1J5N3_9PSEU|nr:three-Cys-motif partner protein TcmP [Amycolatopsis acididurans]NKQ54974.1 three-Cys-motif partner protein TcmP [Amycolatopsis acididurans]